MKNSLLGEDCINSNELIGSIKNYIQYGKNYPGFEIAFIHIIEILLPNYHIKLSHEDYQKVEKLLTKNEASYVSVLDKFKMQLVCTELGEKQFKESVYYTDPANQMADPLFVKRKD